MPSSFMSNNLWAIHVYLWPPSISITEPGPWFNIEMSSYQYRKSHCGDTTVVRSSYLHNGISYTGKTSLYWISSLALSVKTQFISGAVIYSLCHIRSMLIHPSPTSDTLADSSGAKEIFISFYDVVACFMANVRTVHISQKYQDGLVKLAFVISIICYQGYHK